MHIRAKLALLLVMVIALLPTATNAYACGGAGHSLSNVTPKLTAFVNFTWPSWWWWHR